VEKSSIQFIWIGLFLMPSFLQLKVELNWKSTESNWNQYPITWWRSCSRVYLYL